ncbi:terminase gpA endonuclease subunit [Desulfovibrio sp. ZJ200]|uniref:terminase gpA endonuclease subunit n=1 Tax=Desulfovibrio sp. ZJ200 TaxID=2709792 RepID=UPI0013ECCCB4|nr:terminase gpA endonuclease subunit [Desulfovibrio sp. ZJ200]
MDRLPGCIHPETRAAVARLTAERGPILWPWAFGRGERAVLRHRPPIPASLWSERHRVVHNSSRPGPWRNMVTPYAAGVMDAAFYPSVQTVSIMKCPQSAGTEAVHNCIGYTIDRAPGPVLYVYPDETTARENAQDRIIPMLQASPRLREYLTGISDDIGSLRIKLAHLTIYMAWSGSAARLGNKPIRYLVLDELDKYQGSKREASAEALAEKRVITWGKRAITWKLSTPTVVDGPIHKAFAQSEARFRYWVVCPFCGCELLMDFEHIRWPEGHMNPVSLKSHSLGGYECPHCGAERHGWTDADRDLAVRNGLWREETSGRELHEHLETYRPISVGFHIPAWISPFVSLSEIAAKALEYQLNPTLELLKDVQNNYKAEPWEAEFERRDEDMILALCDDRPRGAVPGPLPARKPGGEAQERVAAVLAAVDTQLRYFRYVIRALGYGEEAESWLIQEGVAPTLNALDELFWRSEYLDALGRPFKVRAVIIDAMGDPQRTAQVYAWAARNRGRVFPAQGVHAPATPVSYAPQEYFPGPKGERVKIPGGILLHKVDTTMFKGVLASKLAIAPDDPGAFHLHSGDGLLAYAREMCAEAWNPEKNLWDNPHGRPNHAWDCEYLLWALHWMLAVAKKKRPGAARPAPKALPPKPVPRPAGSVADRLAAFTRR